LVRLESVVAWEVAPVVLKSVPLEKVNVWVVE